MSTPSIQTSLNAGELSPDIFGRVDLAKYRNGCSTLRNAYANYRGGASSRAGTLFCGQCKQGNLGQAAGVPPPRNIAFQYSITQGIVIEAGQNYFRFLSNGAYITETPLSITAVALGGATVLTVPGHAYADGDEVYLGTVGGVPQISNQTFLVSAVSGATFQIITTLNGAPVSSAASSGYTGGGTSGRIYTLATPYNAVDLPYLKWSQSADVMSLMLVNQETGTEYPPYDLERIGVANWTLTQTRFTSSIAPPSFINLGQSSGTSTLNFYYQFVATAVDATTGEESIASPVSTIQSCDQAVIAGSITIQCGNVTGAGSYNFYGGTPTYQNPPNPGAFFGYVGSAFGPSFTDTNIQPDFTITPPLHADPFARSPVASVTMTAQGASYNPTTTTASVTSPTGENPVLTPIVVGGAIVWTAVISGGGGLTGGEAVNFSDSSGLGSGATATLVIGPSSGTWPGCVAYFQERRFYAYTKNNPDTYFGSQPGAFTNMDSSLPVVDDDAITGSPWSQQVNGIQWMINMPGGLVVLTGLGAWQLSGGGGGLAVASAITPANQVANPQAYNGVHNHVPPIVINYDILYVQQQGSIIRDLSYNFFVNIYTGTDMTVLSNHLFDGHQIVEWAWAEEPSKLVWAVRDDGILLCLTYLKEQDVYSWSRHDTNGLFQSICTVSEPPVNAVYVVVKRLIQLDGSGPVWGYYQERMDNRIWTSLDAVWCVDSGLAYGQATPNATLSISSADGVPTLQQPMVVYGGQNYSAETYATVVDPTGTGAVVSLTIVGGVITGASIGGVLTGYTAPVVRVVDPTGVGGNATINTASLNEAVISASAAVFANAAGQGEAGDVIRMKNVSNQGARVCDVLQFLSPQVLLVSVVRDGTASIPNDPLNTPVPSAPGNWTIAAPTSVVYGLSHLEGMLVSILADGIVQAPETVSGGAITLQVPASEITVGLGFAVQIQTLYLDQPGPVTIQGRRKIMDNLTVRVSNTAFPFEVGANQVDASTVPGQIAVTWDNMVEYQGNIGGSTPLQPYSLQTGDFFVDVFASMGETNGQIAIQQTNPLPLNLLAVMPWFRIYDDPSPDS